MKRSPNSGPRQLPNVLRAIQDLGSYHGSTTKKILDQLENTKFSTLERPKNLTTEVRRALKYAVDNGIVNEKAGRFSVASSFRQKKKVNPNSSIFECRRRRRKRSRSSHRRRRRSRRRRHTDRSLSGTGTEEGSADENESIASSSRGRSGYATDGIISHRRHRRRHSRSRSRRRHRRRRRGRKHLDAENLQENSGNDKDGKCTAHQLQNCGICPDNQKDDKMMDDCGPYIN